MWRELRGRRLGAYFRRQHPFGRCFIVDFCCTTRRLVVEIDGAVHRGRRDYDAIRQRLIEERGYRVVRIDAELVERDVAAAVAIVRAALGERACAVLVRRRPRPGRAP